MSLCVSLTLFVCLCHISRNAFISNSLYLSLTYSGAPVILCSECNKIPLCAPILLWLQLNPCLYTYPNLWCQLFPVCRPILSSGLYCSLSVDLSKFTGFLIVNYFCLVSGYISCKDKLSNVTYL